MDKGGESHGAADAADDVDARTVFVRSLPFSLTDAQLEDVFSEVGPVRHCFTIKEKGSEQHRGFGFVQFAVTEDAHRAVQEKNGALLQGRKIKVEVAKRRAPLDVRLPKSDGQNSESADLDHEQSSKSDPRTGDSKKRKSTEPTVRSVKSANGDQPDGKKKPKAGSAVQPAAREGKANEEQSERKKKKDEGDKAEQAKEDVEPLGSSKQRPARTVVVGGLANAEMLDAICNAAQKAGTIEIVQKTMSELELNNRGLAKDGCKPRAAAIVFLSVKAARQAVGILHQKIIAGGVVWARQLGGEGSKLKQLRLIVRNLPFQVTEATLREIFSPAGFVWEITIPRKPDGLSKGFAFIGFTSRADAEKAIKVVNGKLIGKRPVAVDWAVAKKEYEAAVAAPATPAIAPGADLDESESTASESESDGSDDSEDGDSGSDEELEDEAEGLMPGHVVAGKQPPSDARKGKEKTRGHKGLMAERIEEKVPQTKKSGRPVMDDKRLETMDREEEIDMVKKILTRVVASAPDVPSGDEEIVEALESEQQPTGKKQAKDTPAEKVAENGKSADADTKPETESTELVENETDSEESKLSRTVFIRNLPPDAKVPELRKLFSEFGDIKSFRLVLHPVTKKSKGNAFLEYAEQDSAKAAVAAAAKTGVEEVGLILKGRAVTVSIAVDKNSARKIAKETFHKQVEEDKRHLALAKEGQILMGAPAAEGVSKKDMAKRQQYLCACWRRLEHEKATKLRSPNFHVSRTRLLVHNIPKTLAEKELKKLFVEGVKSRASKQNPVIKQVKILRDEDSQKSRGAAFVEFTEHQHALVALRVLNNNPDTFTAEHRPIVEFAIENSLILRKRAANSVQAKSKGPQRKRPDDVHNSGAGAGAGGQQSEGKESAVKEDRKRKRGRDGREDRKATKAAREGKGSPEGEKQEIKEGRKIKRGKTSGADRKAAQAKRASSKATDEDGEPPRGEMKPSRKPQKMGKKETKMVERQQQPVKQPTLPKVTNPRNTANRKRRIPGRGSQVEGKQRKDRRKRGDNEDQLDKLVAEYRTKHFSGVSKRSASKRGSTVPSGDFRRWFE